MHFALALMLAVAAPLAHARFEDATDQEVPHLSEANLLLYVAVGLLLWLFVVWERGWRWRLPPLVLGVACAVALPLWGTSGLGAVVLAAFAGAMGYGVFRRR